jgi:dolichol-phosphate mannosyltransferase
MIAWLIALSTGLLGNSEFAVRLPAIVCGLATAYFMYRWTEQLFGTTSACLVLMLLAVFPFYFATGFFMIPDTPLTAAWAGCLWFLSRALLAESRGAWLGVGICIGLGMLSKYSIALLGPAILAFVILDTRARPWLWRREPYLAILVAALLFGPVVVWNANHDWISFLYQGSDRWSTDIDFSLHILILSALLLITPFGLIGVTLTWLPRRVSGLTQSNNVTSAHRLWLFTVIFSLVPLSVFVLHSLQDNPKIQWTGPLWLAALPVLASAIDPQRADTVRRFRRFFSQKLWKPVAAVMLLLLGGLLFAMTVGPALLPTFDRMGLPVAWEEMMQSVEKIENELERETGARPIVVGLSNYFISAEHAFYDPKGEGVEETGGRGLLGYNGWMWDHWQKPEDYAGRDFVLVTFEPRYLDRARFENRFARITDAKVVPIMKSGRVAGRFSYRIGYGYQPPP